MKVYVLLRYWDNPNNEGNDIMGVYQCVDDAIQDMKIDSKSIEAEYPYDYWDDDYTWRDKREIHLASLKDDIYHATIYCWTIYEEEVRC